MKTAKMSAILVVVLSAILCTGRGALAGEVMAWGDNYFGQCDVPEPNEGFVAVSGRQHHNLGLKANGSIVAWGLNNAGQCDVPLPNESFVAVAAGGQHSLGLKADGSIAAWGYNYYGQCDVPLPNEGFIAVAAGDQHNLGLKADGSIIAWGWNYYGQSDVPETNEDFIAVAGGYSHSLGLKADGSIVAWGNNYYGQCDVPLPNEGFIALAGGVSHSLGLKADGSIVAWGNNTSGQCDVPLPNEDFVAVAGGGNHSLGLKADGSIAAWGYNGSGECDVPEPNEDFVAVAAGLFNSLGLKGEPMGTAFTFQGRLLDANSAANGLYDLEFRLYDSGDLQHGNRVEADDVDVIDGYFTVELDFGTDVFDGLGRWLQVGVRPGDSNDPNAFVTLSPHQEITPTPYAIHAETAVYVKSADYANTADYANMAGDANTAGHATTADYANMAGDANTAGHANTADYANMAGSTAAGITGSGTADYLPKFIDSNTVGDSAIYESGGNVGIGTISPSQKLDVAGGATISGNFGIGTTNPSTKFHLDGQSLWLTGGNGGGFPSSAGAGLRLFHDGSAAHIWAHDYQAQQPTDLIFQSPGGNVGIGTTNPGARLHVIGNIAVTGTVDNVDLSAHAANPNAHHTPPTTLPPSGPAGGDLSGTYPNPSVVDDSHTHSDGTVSDSISINNSRLFAPAGAGNVGIGTTSPTQNLDVAGNIAVSGTVDGVDISAHVGNSNAHHTPPTTLPPSGPAGGDLSGTYPNPSVDNDSHTHGDGTVSDYISINNSRLYAPTGTGNVGIGVTDPGEKLDVYGIVKASSFTDRENGNYYLDPASSSNLYELWARGPVYMPAVYYYSHGLAGRDVKVVEGGRLGTAVSSKRYKENIVPLEDDFSKILQAKIVKFIYKKTKEADIGLIAEDLDELGLKNLVFYDAEGRPDAVRYDFISLYLLEVLKEQANSIKELKVENESLKEQLQKENQSLKQRLNALERTLQQIAKAKEIKL